MIKKFSIFNFQFISGFTLVELLVVMAIISILAGIVWGNFFTSISKGRDSKRKQDLESISRSLELYYNDNKMYPNSTPPWGQAFPHPTKFTVIYMQKVPADPAYPGASYCYTADPEGKGIYYKLYANLENTNDPKVFTTPILCNTVYYNYGISSSNTTP